MGVTGVRNTGQQSRESCTVGLLKGHSSSMTGLTWTWRWSECEIDQNPVYDSHQPNMYRHFCWKKAKDRKATTINPKLQLKMVEEWIFFGMLEVDIEVPPQLMDYFEEFCPLFVTCSIPTEPIGDTMQQYTEEKKLSKLPCRQLVADRAAC